MSYRCQIFHTPYEAFVRQFERAHFNSSHLPYESLYERFLATHYPLANCYAPYLGRLGYDAEEVFSSVPMLQKRWADERGLRYSETDWLEDIVVAQASVFQPDVVILLDLFRFNARFRARLREAMGRRTFLIGWRFAPTSDMTVFRDLDLLLTGSRDYAGILREHGANAEYLPHAFDPILAAKAPLEADRDLVFTFTGNLGDRNGHHAQRYALIEVLMCETPLEVWAPMEEPGSRSLRHRVLDRISYQANRAFSTVGVSTHQRAKLPVLRRGARWCWDPSTPSLRSRHPDRCHDPVFAMENYKVLGRSRITLNMHIDGTGQHAGNIRLFEGTGMGACLVTDWKVNLRELFEPDHEVVAYRSTEECVDKVRYLLQNEAVRQSIAAAGHQRLLREHTWANRCRALDDIIRGHV
jgi:hypothetical protein